jgi:hypothetical protein
LAMSVDKVPPVAFSNKATRVLIGVVSRRRSAS